VREVQVVVAKEREVVGTNDLGGKTSADCLQAIAPRRVGVLVPLELPDVSGVDARVEVMHPGGVAQRSERLVHHEQLSAGPQNAVDLLQRAPQTLQIVVVQDLTTEDIVQAPGGQRDVVHRAEYPLEVDLAILEKVVRGVEALKLHRRDVQRYGAQSVLGERVGGPAALGAEVEQVLPGLKRDSQKQLVQ